MRDLIQAEIDRVEALESKSYYHQGYLNGLVFVQNVYSDTQSAKSQRLQALEATKNGVYNRINAAAKSGDTSIDITIRDSNISDVIVKELYDNGYYIGREGSSVNIGW